MNDFVEGSLEAHLEETVSFVKDEVLDGLEVKIHLNSKMKESARGSDNPGIDYKYLQIRARVEITYTSGLLVIISNCSSKLSPPTIKPHLRA